MAKNLSYFFYISGLQSFFLWINFDVIAALLLYDIEKIERVINEDKIAITENKELIRFFFKEFFFSRVVLY